MKNEAKNLPRRVITWGSGASTCSFRVSREGLRSNKNDKIQVFKYSPPEWMDGFPSARGWREKHSNPWIILGKFVSPCSIKTARLRGT